EVQITKEYAIIPRVYPVIDYATKITPLVVDSVTKEAFYRVTRCFKVPLTLRANALVIRVSTFR
ncbi:hypothetical protein OFN53_41040, partial [Escherichia coli]|nr:hypothetical protein [Escherichia coli]